MTTILPVFANKQLHDCRNLERAWKTAVVSGQSIVGMLAAMVLAKAGYLVDCFEIRDDYTRNIQWAVRQSLVDQLSSIDEKMMEAFLKEVVTPIDRGSIHIYPSGRKRAKPHTGLTNGRATNIPSTCQEMMNLPSGGIVEAKTFENFLKGYLISMQGIRLHHESATEKVFLDRYNELSNCNKPDLVVIAEGANSISKKILGIPLEIVSKGRLQIAGTIKIDSQGVMVKHWRREYGDVHLTGIMGRKGTKRTWVVADIHPSQTANQSMIDTEFRRIISDALDLPIGLVISKPISGVTDDKPVTPFLLTQSISATATDGDSVVLIGDAVGSAHWSVGGGMQTAAVCHIQRLRKLLSDLEENCEKSKALQSYSDGVLDDTRTWIDVSCKDDGKTHSLLSRSSLDS